MQSTKCSADWNEHTSKSHARNESTYKLNSQPIIYSRLFVIWYLNQFSYKFFHFGQTHFHHFSRNVNAVFDFIRYVCPIINAIPLFFFQMIDISNRADVCV